MPRFRNWWIGERVLVAVAVLTLAVCSRGQQPAGTAGFEVASVRATNSTDGRALIQATPGRLAITNLVLRRLILIAYAVNDDQLVGGPDWINSAHYDIQAKADGNPAVEQMEGPMLQSLLQERFRLKVHRETRQLKVYKILLAKGGSKLQRTKEGACVVYVANAAPPAAPATQARPNYCGLHAAADGVNRTLEGKGVTMASLAASLSRSYTAALGRNVIDGTELTGGFDIHLEWANEPAGAGVANADTQPPEEQSKPSIFTALQEQLGLRLESASNAVEVLVIDHVETPTQN
jgi:uncharacterized protein (TIGR03435 family)